MIIREYVPLADKTWFKIGGPARYFCEPVTPHNFQEALIFAKTHKLEIFVLGQGANILVHDDGFDGLVIHPATTTPTIKGNLVTASAGTTMNDLIEFTLDHGLTGLEVFSNIPGSIGGSAYINLHYFEYFLSDFLVSATVIDKLTGKSKSVDKAWFNFGYDTSTLVDGNYYLLDATFALKQSTPEEVAYARGRRFEITRHRMSRYPKGFTCGSFFRNFTPDEVTIERDGRKMIYVAFYLDQIGVKGTEHVNNAWVSGMHANMLVNMGGASAQDIVTLARTLQEKVQERFGIIPQPECIFVGFKQYPLL